MTESSSRALFGHRVRIGAASRVPSGSPGAYLLRAEPGFARTVVAARVLAKRHLPLQAAKALVERLLEQEEVTVEIPKIEDAEAFERELEVLGIKAMRQDSSRELTAASRSAGH